MKKIYWLLLCFLMLSGQGCLPPASHRIFWAYPDNLQDGRSYEYVAEYEAPPDFIRDCGSGAVARHCPGAKELPLNLRRQYLARAMAAHKSVLRNDDPAESLISAGGRLYFFDPLDDAVMAGEEITGQRLWRAEAGAAYACYSPLVLAGESLYLTCRHRLGADHLVFSFSADTGAVQGALPLEGRAAALIAHGDRILILQSDGVLFSWKASDESASVAAELDDLFQPVDELLPGELRSPAPSLQGNGKIFLGGKRNQWALDAKTLRPVWKYALSSQTAALAAPDDGMTLYVITEGADILTLDSATGKELAVWDKSKSDVNWFRATLGPSPRWNRVIWNQGDAAPGQLVFCDGFGLCYGFDTAKNQLRWAMSVSSRYRTIRPYIRGEDLLVDLAPVRLLLFPSMPVPAPTQAP